MRAFWSGLLVAAAFAVGVPLVHVLRSGEAPMGASLGAEPAGQGSAHDRDDLALPVEGRHLRVSVAAARPAPAAPGPLHVLLIVVDSLRADMPWTGYERPIAPWLTAFAQRSVTYTRAYSISSSTARSVGPLLVGRYPSEMERNGLFFSHWYPSNEFVSERLSAAGHHTAALLTHTYFTPGSTGMDQGFLDYVVIPGKRVAAADEASKPARRTTERAREMIQAAAEGLTGKERFFVYLHYIDPHAPYRPHRSRPTWGDGPRDLYDQEVHYTDEWIGNLVDWARAQPWGESLAVIVTADHGEAMGEHGRYKHGYELWEEMTRVPLIVNVPGVAARRIDLPRSHIDLAPTLLELMGMERSGALSGVSLVPEILGGNSERRTVVLDLPGDDLQEQRRAIIEGNLKLIVSGKDERAALFDLEADPEERHDLAAAGDARLQHMLAHYARVSAGMASGAVRGTNPH
ncbi:MAG TPA: sulfatase [Polyangiaceae bacterium]|nr:sulfatase [Polyangiaceae bacterium]